MPGCTISWREHRHALAGRRGGCSCGGRWRGRWPRPDLREALAAWWAPRLERIADWVAEAGGGAAQRCSPPVALVARGERHARAAASWRAVPADRPGRPDRAAARRRAGDPRLQDRDAAEPEGGGCRPGAATAAGGGDGRGRRVRRGDLPGRRTELTYWHLTGGFHAGELRTLFKADAGSDRHGGGERARGAVRADRCLRRAGPLLSVAAAARARRRGSPTTRSLRGGGVGGEWWRPAPHPLPRGERVTCTPPPLRRVGERGRLRATAPTRNSSRPPIPSVSAFVAASAGSGKTKLLTDRLLRLMLTGAAPERIQCLTFTKAAAAEMAVRLQRTLGRWVTLRRRGAGARTARAATSSHPKRP